MDWRLACVRMLLFGSSTGQGVLATLLYVWHRQNEQLAFLIASFIVAIGLVPALVWNPRCLWWWYLLHVVSVAFLLAATIYFLVKESNAFRESHGSMSPIYVLIVALAMISLFLVGFSFPTVVQTPPREEDTEKAENGKQFDSELASAEWNSSAACSEQLSLNKLHQVTSPPLGSNPLNNKDSERTLVGKNAPLVPKNDEEFDLASVNWVVQASMAPSALDDHLGENWMASRQHYTFGGSESKLPHVSELSSVHSGRGASGLGRSNTTGQLSMKKARRDRSNTSAGNFITRDQLNVLQSGRNLLTTPSAHKHDRSQSIDPGFHFLSKSHHQASPSQSTTQYTDHNYGRGSQCTFPRLSFSEAPVQSKVFHTSELGSSSDGTMPNSPDENRFFAAPPQTSPKMHSAGSSMGDIMEGLEEIPHGMPRWNIRQPSALMQNVSLQEWETKKNSWLACEHDIKPLVFYLNTHSAVESQVSPGRKHYDQTLTNATTDGILMRSFSAPSLHTYRQVSDSKSRSGSQALALDDTIVLPDHDSYALYRTQTPPALTLVSEAPSVNTSPIRKIMSFMKRDLFLEANASYGGGSIANTASGHKHSESVTASMVSSATGKSSRSGLPRKSIKNLFTRSQSTEQPIRSSFAFAMTPRMSPQKEPQPLLYSKPKIPLNFRFQDWETDTLENLDRSRVSSVPSAVIGEYDREKWRTLKVLKQRDVS